MKAVYPGTFDPITYGHLDLIKRACRLFDEVVVAVACNEHKSPLFSVQERIEMLKKATGDLGKRLYIDSFDSLTVDYVRERDCDVIIRGIRMVSDFEYEFQMTLTNRKLAPQVETIFMMPEESYSYISSNLIKEIVALGGEVDAFVPDFVSEALKNKILKDR